MTVYTISTTRIANRAHTNVNHDSDHSSSPSSTQTDFPLLEGAQGTLDQLARLVVKLVLWRLEHLLQDGDQFGHELGYRGFLLSVWVRVSYGALHERALRETYKDSGGSSTQARSLRNPLSEEADSPVPGARQPGGPCPGAPQSYGTSNRQRYPGFEPP